MENSLIESCQNNRNNRKERKSTNKSNNNQSKNLINKLKRIKIPLLKFQTIFNQRLLKTMRHNK